MRQDVIECAEVIGLVAWAILTWPFDGLGNRLDYWRWQRAHARAGLEMQNGRSVRRRRG